MIGEDVPTLKNVQDQEMVIRICAAIYTYMKVRVT